MLRFTNAIYGTEMYHYFDGFQQGPCFSKPDDYQDCDVALVAISLRMTSALLHLFCDVTPVFVTSQRGAWSST